jgi:alpha-L-rhamnosidase
MQSAYQIIVRDAKNTSVWDSGEVQSNQTLFVPYGGGKTLTSDTMYRFFVTVWLNGQAEPSPEASATFSTALVTSEEWTAKWVTSSKGNAQFRSEFSLDDVPERASAFFVGVGYGHLYINGQRIQTRGGGDELGPWTTWSKRILYRAYAIPAGLLKKGTNALGVRLGNGQFNSHWHHSSLLALRLQVHAHLPGGKVDIVKSSAAANWKDARAPSTHNDIYKGETFDGRLDVQGWAMPGFDDASWSDSVDVPNSTNVPANGAIANNDQNNTDHTRNLILAEDGSASLTAGATAHSSLTAGATAHSSLTAGATAHSSLTAGATAHSSLTERSPLCKAPATSSRTQQK